MDFSVVGIKSHTIVVAGVTQPSPRALLKEFLKVTILNPFFAGSSMTHKIRSKEVY